MQDSVSSINTTLSNIASTMSDTSTAAKTYVDNLSEQYDNSSKTLSESLGSLSDSIGESNPEAQQYMNNIHNSLDKIDSIQGNNHILNKEQAEAGGKKKGRISTVICPTFVEQSPIPIKRQKILWMIFPIR